MAAAIKRLLFLMAAARLFLALNAHIKLLLTTRKILFTQGYHSIYLRFKIEPFASN